MQLKADKWTFTCVYVCICQVSVSVSQLPHEDSPSSKRCGWWPILCGWYSVIHTLPDTAKWPISVVFFAPSLHIFCFLHVISIIYSLILCRDGVSSMKSLVPLLWGLLLGFVGNYGKPQDEASCRETEPCQFTTLYHVITPGSNTGTSQIKITFVTFKFIHLFIFFLNYKSSRPTLLWNTSTLFCGVCPPNQTFSTQRLLLCWQ